MSNMQPRKYGIKRPGCKWHWICTKRATGTWRLEKIEVKDIWWVTSGRYSGRRVDDNGSHGSFPEATWSIAESMFLASTLHMASDGLFGSQWLHNRLLFSSRAIIFHCCSSQSGYQSGTGKTGIWRAETLAVSGRVCCTGQADFGKYVYRDRVDRICILVTASLWLLQQERKKERKKEKAGIINLCFDSRWNRSTLINKVPATWWERIRYSKDQKRIKKELKKM